MSSASDKCALLDVPLRPDDHVVGAVDIDEVVVAGLEKIPPKRGVQPVAGQDEAKVLLVRAQVTVGDVEPQRRAAEVHEHVKDGHEEQPQALAHGVVGGERLGVEKVDGDEGIFHPQVRLAPETVLVRGERRRERFLQSETN